MNKLTREARFRFIKIMDMGYMVILYFMFGVFLSMITDFIFGGYTEEEIKAKSTPQLILELIAMIWFNMILFYIARNIMEFIPSPFNGLYGYDHSRLKEITDTAILGFTYLYFQNELRSKLLELKRRISFTEDSEKETPEFL
jgi:hypothetical protein